MGEEEKQRESGRRKERERERELVGRSQRALSAVCCLVHLPAQPVPPTHTSSVLCKPHKNTTMTTDQTETLTHAHTYIHTQARSDPKSHPHIPLASKRNWFLILLGVLLLEHNLAAHDAGAGV